MDAATRRPQLPALSYLDIDQPKSDESSRTSAVSPTHPPPHGHPPSQHAPAWPPLHSDPREPRTEEHESTKAASRHSLPSLSEALGVESPRTFSASKPTIPPPFSSAAASPSSPSLRRSYGSEDLSHLRNGTLHQSSVRRDSVDPQPYPSDPHKPAQSSSREPRPSLHLQTSRPDRLERYGHYDPSPSRSSSLMGPPSVPYGYSSYQARSAESGPASGYSSGPIYQPSSQFAAPSASAPSWRAESAPLRPEFDDHSAHSSTYGESVKRHLDLFDLETALNDISQTSGIVADFSRRYSERMHQTARATPSLATLPSLIEVDDMMSKSRIQLEALTKIRDVILAEQAAYEQQVADQRHQAKIYRETAPPPALPDKSEDVEGGGGFAGPEPKKRRGRAAPPGRCHSCNRAETPEWRRGPDGARTLCNACGLHYAKLTRKQNNASKAASVGSSNLRPKESA